MINFAVNFLLRYFILISDRGAQKEGWRRIFEILRQVSGFGGKVGPPGDYLEVGELSNVA